MSDAPISPDPRIAVRFTRKTGKSQWEEIIGPFPLSAIPRVGEFVTILNHDGAYGGSVVSVCWTIPDDGGIVEVDVELCPNTRAEGQPPSLEAHQ